jgi:hypothetical protein
VVASGICVRACVCVCVCVRLCVWAYPCAVPVQKVMSFLVDLAERVRPHALADVAQLQAAKAEEVGPSGGPGARGPTVQEWDLPRYKRAVRERDLGPAVSTLAEYFPMAAVLQGLQLVAARAFGVTMTQVPMEPREAWTGAWSGWGWGVGGTVCVAVGGGCGTAGRPCACAVCCFWRCARFQWCGRGGAGEGEGRGHPLLAKQPGCSSKAHRALPAP